MNHFKTYITLLVIVSLTGCAGPRPITDPTMSLDAPGFSVLPPQEEGWYIWQKSRDSLTLGKKGKHIDESYIITVEIKELPEKVRTKEDFHDFIDLVLRTMEEQEKWDTRFVTLESKYWPSDERSEPCVRYVKAFEDHGARKGSDRKDPMILMAEGLFCRHPYKKNMAVRIDYSHRCYEENRDPEFKKKAADCLEKLKLLDY